MSEIGEGHEKPINPRYSRKVAETRRAIQPSVKLALQPIQGKSADIIREVKRGVAIGAGNEYLNAQVDQRTGLLRQEAFRLVTEKKLAQLNRKQADTLKEGLTVTVIDADDFGALNKKEGFNTGNAALEAAGQAIKETIREDDWEGRLGGEELAVAQPYSSDRPQSFEDMTHPAERLRRVLEQTLITNPNTNEQFSITGSFGTTDAELNETYDNIIDRADRAVKVAKLLGKNRVLHARTTTPGDNNYLSMTDITTNDSDRERKTNGEAKARLYTYVKDPKFGELLIEEDGSKKTHRIFDDPRDPNHKKQKLYEVTEVDPVLGHILFDKDLQMTYIVGTRPLPGGKSEQYLQEYLAA